MKRTGLTQQQKIERLKRAGFKVELQGRNIRAVKGSVIMNGTVNQVYHDNFG